MALERLARGIWVSPVVTADQVSIVGLRNVRRAEGDRHLLRKPVHPE